MRAFIEIVEGKMDTMDFGVSGSPKKTDSDRKAVFSEYQAVRLKKAITHKGVTYPIHTRGVIVDIHNNGEGFEVELFQPAPGVVGLYPHQIEPV